MLQKMNNKKRFLAVLLTICMLFSISGNTLAYAAELFNTTGSAIQYSNTTTDSTITSLFKNTTSGSSLQHSTSLSALKTTSSVLSFKADLYEDEDLTILSGTLTGTGNACIYDWNYDEPRYLHITINNLPNVDQYYYQVKVILDDILYTVKGGEQELYYYVEYGETEYTVTVPIWYDVDQWNKQENTPLGDGISSLIHVSLQRSEDSLPKVSTWSLRSNIDTIDDNVENIATLSLLQATTGEGIETVKIGVYSDANRTQQETLLTSDGITLENWGYDEDRYLGVHLSNLSMDADTYYKLVIEMDPILYLNQNDEPSLNGATITYEKNDALSVNGTGTYAVKTYSLKELTYRFEDTETISFGLPLRFDTVLWNKQDGGSLGDGTKPLMCVYLIKCETGKDTGDTIYTGYLQQAKASGSIADKPSISYYPEGAASGSGGNTIGTDGTIRLYANRVNNISMGYYYKNIKVDIISPNCMIDGVTYTLVNESFTFSNANGELPITTTSENGVTSWYAENMYASNTSLFNVQYKAPEAIKDIVGVHRFEGKVTVTIDCGTESEIMLMDNVSITIKVDNQGEPILASNSVDGTPILTDTVQYLGRLALQNNAAFTNGSGPLKVQIAFDVNNTNAVGVTSLQLMCDRDTEYINIWYTLVDESGNLVMDKENQPCVYNQTIVNPHYNPESKNTSNLYALFNRASAAVPNDCYFKAVTYTIGNLDGETKAYHAGAAKATYSAGAFGGYVLLDTIPAEKITHRMQVYQVVTNDNGIMSEVELSELAKEASTNIKTADKITVGYGLSGAAVSSDTVNAGDPFTISGNIFVTEYPYGISNVLDNIRIGLLLPDGIEVNKTSIVCKTAGENLEVVSVEKELTESGKYFWTIAFKEGQKIGWFNENLKAISNGYELSFSMQLNTAKTLPTQNIILRQAVFAAGKGIDNLASGSYSENACLDTYDLNANGSYTDHVACFKSTVNTSVTITSYPAQLTITDSLRKENGATDSNLLMESFADVIYYDLNIACTDGGTADGFYYYIPIPKASMQNESDFLVANGVDATKLTLAITEEPTVENKSGTVMNLLFTTEDVKTYADISAVTNWSSTLPSGKTWADVTALKVYTSAAHIENGSQTIISVPLKYVGDEVAYNTYAGMPIKWKSRGYYNYTLGANTFAGLKSTEGCTITLTYTKQDSEEFTLTAKKGNNGNTADSMRYYELKLPQFILAQEYSIREITPHNIVLADSNYNFDNADSTAANNTFHITVSVKDDSNEYSAPADIKENGKVVGRLAANKAPTFRFEIFNADALSDIVTERYVELMLIGDNGVIVPVKINIAREMAEAEAKTPAITAGKQYRPFDGEVDENNNPKLAVISRDSAFTAQFVTEDFIPSNHSNARLVFNETPAAGTKIAMIDWTDSDNVKYYYLSKKDNLGKEILLTDFVEMGSNEVFYVENQNSESVTERLLFVVELPQGYNGAGNSLYLTRIFKDDGQNTAVNSKTLSFATTDVRAFNLFSDKVNVPVNTVVTFTYTSELTDNIDSRYADRNLSLVIQAQDTETIPYDTKLLADGTIYYLNAEGQFIVPLTQVQDGSNTKAISVVTESEHEINLKAELYASATANGAKPFAGEKIVSNLVTITVADKNDSKPSMEVTGSTRLLHWDDLKKTMLLQISSQNVIGGLTVELQSKSYANGSIVYTTQTTILEAVNGNIEHSQGVFGISTSIESITVKLKEQTSPGTYRLLFKATNGGKAIEIPYNFIVVE